MTVMVKKLEKDFFEIWPDQMIGCAKIDPVKERFCPLIDR